MRALVTGGAGLIGSHIVDLLVERGDKVRVLDSLDPVTHPQGKPDWANPHAEFFQGDVRDYVTCLRATAGCDVVFHEAAFGGFAPDAALKMTAANALGTANVLTASREANVERVVVASSQAVYGPLPRPRAELEAGIWGDPSPKLSEVSPLAFPSVYALSKFYTEELALQCGEGWGLPVTALRYALTYGPRQSVSNPYTGICSIFSTRLLNGLPPIVYEDGHQTRDFTYVEDVARANLLVADTDTGGEVFNVGTGKATSVLEFARLLAEAYGVDIQPELTGEHRPADARSTVTDPSKLMALGWEPQVRVEEGVRRYADWILTLDRPAETLSAALPELRAAGVVR